PEQRNAELLKVGVGITLLLATEGISSISSEVVVAKTSADFVSNVTATSFGKVWGQGTVNVGKTINAIRNGSLKPAGVYNNLEKHSQLLGKPNGYWQKFELIDYGSKAPLRIIKGGNGELFLTPDHYKSLIPLGGH
ncbi:MAG: hypothetical protein SGJ00_00780, partial [bacterium]|nr:hypothetical protein [bacterium]